MKNLYQTLLLKLRDTKYYRVVLLLLILLYLVYLAGEIITDFFQLSPKGFQVEKLETFIHYNKLLIVLIFGIAVPFFETFIFQMVMMEGIPAIIRKSKYRFCIAIIISAAAFGLYNYYNAGYAVYYFFNGLIFAFAYYLGKIREETAFFLPFTVHVLWNFFLIIDKIIK